MGGSANNDRPEVSELELGAGLPTLRIGSGPRTLVYFPGLSLHPGLPTGMERRMATSGWDALLPDYSVYRIGRRVRPVGTSFADMAEDAIAAIETLGPPVDLIGASTGGMLALHVAALRPDVVRRLVVVISGTTLSDHGRAVGRRVVDAANAGHWRTVYSSIMPIGGSTPLRRAVYGALGWLLGPRLMGIPSDPTMFLAELDAWLRVDAEPTLDRIGIPTLIIGGGADQVFPPSITEATGHDIRNATVTIVPGLAHDFPARLTSDHIAPFLQQVGSPRAMSTGG
jgi:pimeloyl-ACP methyl ester carboxylesterase